MGKCCYSVWHWKFSVFEPQLPARYPAVGCVLNKDGGTTPQTYCDRGKVRTRLRSLSHSNSTPSHLVLLPPKKVQGLHKRTSSREGPPVGTSTPTALGRVGEGRSDVSTWGSCEKESQWGDSTLWAQGQRGQVPVEATSQEQPQLKAGETHLNDPSRRDRSQAPYGHLQHTQPVMASSKHHVLSLLSLLSRCFLNLIPYTPTHSQVGRAVVPTGEVNKGLRGTKPTCGGAHSVGECAVPLPAAWMWHPATEGQMCRQEQMPNCF